MAARAENVLFAFIAAAPTALCLQERHSVPEIEAIQTHPPGKGNNEMRKIYRGQALPPHAIPLQKNWAQNAESSEQVLSSTTPINNQLPHHQPRALNLPKNFPFPISSATLPHAP